MSVLAIQSVEQWKSFISSKPIVCAYIWASWCEPCQLMTQVIEQLAIRHGSVISFASIDAESQSALMDQLTVEAVPYMVLIRKGVIASRQEGALPQEWARVVSDAAAAAETPSEWTTEELAKLVQKKPVMLFMKGTPEQPRCGFSRRMVDILEKHQIVYGSFDILSDSGVRDGLKKYSNWPTYPQLYVQGKLIGGLDVVTEMEEGGELLPVIPESSLRPRDLNDYLTKLIRKEKVMLFMKGTPEQPRCGFSGRMVALLQKEGAKFGSFDILQDENVREGLKKYSNWPTYPQLYVDGKLLGGLDICNEMAEDGSLADVLK